MTVAIPCPSGLFGSVPVCTCKLTFPLPTPVATWADVPCWMNLECTLLWAGIVIAVSNTAIAANSCFISISPHVRVCAALPLYLGRLNIRHGGPSGYYGGYLPIALLHLRFSA